MLIKLHGYIKALERIFERIKKYPIILNIYNTPKIPKDLCCEINRIQDEKRMARRAAREAQMGLLPKPILFIIFGDFGWYIKKKSMRILNLNLCGNLWG